MCSSSAARKQIVEARTVRVFTDTAGNFGDPSTRIILDEAKKLTPAERQALAARSNEGEMVFVNDLEAADISIFSPQREIAFAGTAALAAAWLITKLRGQPIAALVCAGKQITTWQDGELTWVRASLESMPSWNHQQLASPEAVERLTVKEAATLEHTMVWAWTDEAKGSIRARTFASDWDIPEAEGNGSGSMMLAAQLNRSLEITHGKGSVIFAKPAAGNCADIGGRILEDPPETF